MSYEIFNSRKESHDLDSTAIIEGAPAGLFLYLKRIIKSLPNVDKVVMVVVLG